MARHDPPQVAPAPDKFVASLKVMREGKVSAELDASFAEVVGAVLSTGKKGKLTIEITVAPVKGGEPNMLFVGDAIKVTLPKLDKAATMFFAQDDLSLSRRDPRQPSLEMGPGLVTRPALVGPTPIRPADVIEGNSGN